MIIMGEDAQRVKDRDAQEHNIRAARAVADAVRSTLGPKGMDKMLVSSIGDVTVTNDGVTILDEMDIDNPTAEMIIEVADTQEDEAGDGTTTAVALAGELLKNAENLLEQDIHPTAIIRGFNLASEKAREEIDAVSESVAADDDETLRKVAQTSITGKGAEVNKEVIAELIVEAMKAAQAHKLIVDPGIPNCDVPQQGDSSLQFAQMEPGTYLDSVPYTVRVFGVWRCSRTRDFGAGLCIRH
jgi:chaperonin GroEL (HSP60 family)